MNKYAVIRSTASSDSVTFFSSLENARSHAETLAKAYVSSKVAVFQLCGIASVEVKFHENLDSR